MGVRPEVLARVWDAVERLYRSGIHPAIALCVRYCDQVLLDRAIGYAAGNGPDDPPDTPKQVVTPDTPFSTLSASKPLAAMVMHLLAERRLLHLDDPGDALQRLPHLLCRARDYAQQSRHAIGTLSEFTDLLGIISVLSALTSRRDQHDHHVTVVIRWAARAQREAPSRYVPGEVS